jgi:hypothetical protein
MTLPMERYLMDKDNSFDLVDNIISTIRNNLENFADNFLELSRQLYSIENMRLSNIPEKYILQSLLTDNSLILKIINKTADEELLMKLTEKLMANE